MQKIIPLLLLCLVFGTQIKAQSLIPEVENTNEHQNNIRKSKDVRRGTILNPSMSAVRIPSNASITLDGYLDETEWQNAPYATDFTQRFPDDGGTPSQRTEARILYTDSHIFVGVMAYESNPDSITKALFRRDGNEASDWVYVSFDSYNDKRTAFTFAVNPSGVQKDVLYFDDSGEDILWDAVWEAKAKITNEGWSIEMKIPLSQLRFSSNQSVQTWGVNFQRRIARNNEFNYWSATSQRESGAVSKFGRLDGIRDLEEPRRLEITPYISGSLTREPGDNSNPYYNANDFGENFGGDIKYGITSDLTLTATINPDFGQVEADPATINLSQFEIFFPERRPFFLEGNDIFRFGRTNTNNSAGNPNTFYSRRIGRTPQGNLGGANAFNNGSYFNADSVYAFGKIYQDVPDQTNIAAAAKLSGKTQNGWSIGLLNAITLEEKGDFTALQGSALGKTTGTFIAEPTTNYLVSRVKKDINEGNTVAGGYFSAVNRRIDNTYFETYLRNSAYIAGADFEHNWNNREYVASGSFSVTQINGTKDVITAAQRAPQRYYQRIDSDGLGIDASKTSLEGYAGELSLRKAGGDHFTGSVTYSEVSPGYETNDIGFQNRADYRAMAFSFQWQETSPKHVQYWEVWNYHLYGWNFDGDVIWRNINFGGFTRFNNNWHFNMNMNTSFGQYSDRLTRGGPLMKVNGGTGFNFNVGSDRSRDISFGHGQYHRRDVGKEFDDYYWADISFRPVTNLQLTLQPEIGFEKDEDQFVANIARDVNDTDADQTYGRRYIFADSRSMNFSTEIRLNWTFNPTMSLQTFVRPFINSFKFSNFGEFKTPGTFEFDRYGEDEGTITDAGFGNYAVDIDNNGETDFSFSRSDFTYRSLQGNAVFRWEYKPGSTLFLVWQQSRSFRIGDGRYDIGRDLMDILDPKPSNIFLIKLSYWLSS